MIELKTASKTEGAIDGSRLQTRKPWYFYMLQTMAAILVVTLSLEFLFAMAGIGEEEYLKPDPVLGYSPMPNKHVTKKGEGLGQAQYNKYGLPEPERALIKPEGTYRIAVLGDSFVEALQVERKENFCYLLEEYLNEKNPGKHFEVMNFGVAGYSLGQMYLRLKNLALQFNPDMVILAVRGDTTFVLRPSPAIDLIGARPSFFLDGNNGLIVDYTVHKEWLRTKAGRRMQLTGWLREHSRIWGVFSVAVQQALAWSQGLTKGTTWGAAVTNKQTAFAASNKESQSLAEHPVSTSPAKPETFMIGNTVISSQQYFEARDNGIRYFWPIVDAIMVAMKKECDAHNCKLTVVRLPGAGGKTNELETSKFEQSSRRLGIPFADSTAALAKNPAGKLYYQIHFNQLGHRLFAKEIEPFIWQQVETNLQ